MTSTLYRRVANNLHFGLIVVALLVMTYNAVVHDPRVGYDVAAHRDYAVTLATLRLPTEQETTEFFSPPLAYLPPALLLAAKCPVPLAMKLWQIIQVAYAGVLLITLAKTLNVLRATNVAKVAAFATILMAGVWWRSFAMIRPEALVATLVTAAVYNTIRLQQGDRQQWRFILLGLLWGTACITRQWAIFALLPSLLVVFLAPMKDNAWWTGAAKAAAVCCVIAAPFYLSLLVRFGTVRPFNRSVSTDSNLSWRWNPISVSRSPVTRGHIDQPLNILYGDTFGDYWAYFLLRGKQPLNKRLLVGTPLIDAIAASPSNVSSNVRPMSRYLGFVLLVSIPATLLILVSGVWSAITGLLALRNPADRSGRQLLPILLAFGGTIAGYAWFVVSYAATKNDTDTVKATYILQAWPLAGLLVGVFVEEIHKRIGMVGFLLLVGLVATLLLNSGTFLTRCVMF